MSNHVRKQIRAALQTALTGLTLTGANVFLERKHRLQTSQLPALLIYFEEEESRPEGMKAGSTRVYERSAKYLVQGVVADQAGVEDDLDDVSAQVEAAIGTDRTLGGLVRSTTLESTQQGIGKIGAGGDTPVGAVILAFRVRYLTDEANPETSI